jgi:hypothetical protein
MPFQTHFIVLEDDSNFEAQIQEMEGGFAITYYTYAMKPLASYLPYKTVGGNLQYAKKWAEATLIIARKIQLGV